MAPFWKDPKYRGGMIQGIGVGIISSLLIGLDGKWLVGLGLFIVLIGAFWVNVLAPRK